jgi:RNA polymerase sigma-70 factor (ECF subfamily)
MAEPVAYGHRFSRGGALSSRPEGSTTMPKHADDEASAREVIDQYLHRLVELVRKRLSQRLAGRVDPEDVVQSVFRTYFAGKKEGKFDLKQREDVGKLLMKIALHKVLKQVEHHTAAKRDPRREAEQGNRTLERLQELRANGPAPEAEVVFIDTLEHWLRKLGPEARRVVELRMQGYTSQEIAAQLGTHDRKVRRIFERIREQAALTGLGP